MWQWNVDLMRMQVVALFPQLPGLHPLLSVPPIQLPASASNGLTQVCFPLHFHHQQATSQCVSQSNPNQEKDWESVLL